MNWARILPWGALLLILGTQLPIFLQMPLPPDAVLYDIQTRCLLEGGVLYRDVIEPNLPGVVWVHTLVRSFAGWSPMALRSFDLLVVMMIALLLSRFVTEPLSEVFHKRMARGVLLSGVLLFYFSTSEWCHCQRDTWMLLPCLMATMVRWHVVKQWLITPTSRQPASQRTLILVGGLLEGILWALGFWLKPFVAVPAMAVLLGTRTYVRRDKSLSNALEDFEAAEPANTPSSGLAATFSPWPGEKGLCWAWGIGVAAVILGGMIVGGIGIVWMMWSGCWPHFLEMLTEWNADYFQSGRSRWTVERYLFHVERFWPWILLHAPALIISLRHALRSVRCAAGNHADSSTIAVALLRSLYLGWIIQAFALQQLFDYIHVPGVMLALAVCVQSSAFALKSTPRVITTVTAPQLSLRSMITPLAVSLVGLYVVGSPIFRSDRQEHWLACFQACMGSPLDLQIKDDLTHCPLPRWTELQPLLDRIQRMQIPDGAVMAYNGSLVHLYPELGFHPPTRFVYLDVLARCFPCRRPEMLAKLEHAKIRYAVSNLIEDGWEGDLSGDFMLPASISDRSATLFFPYNQTPIYRSGSYVLFEVNRPIGSLTSESCPLSPGGIWWLTSATANDD